MLYIISASPMPTMRIRLANSPRCISTPSTHHSPNPSNTSPSTLCTRSSLRNPQTAQALTPTTPPSFTPTARTPIVSRISGTTNPSTPPSLSVPTTAFLTSATALLNLPTCPCHTLSTSATSLSSLCASTRSREVTFMPPFEPAAPIRIDCARFESRFQRLLRPAMMRAQTMDSAM